MDQDKMKRIVRITIGLVIAIFLILLFSGVDFKTWAGIKKVSTIFSGVVLFWAFYFAIGWRWPILKYIVHTENLNGTWFGEYSSVDAGGKNIQGEISVVIRQSFLNISVVSFTTQYLAYSYGEAILHNGKSKSNQLIYLYSQNQFNPTDKVARKGTSELILISEANKQKLFGDFWTNHNSEGSLKLLKITSRHLKSFTDAKKIIK